MRNLLITSQLLLFLLFAAPVQGGEGMDIPKLKDAFKGKFDVGAAINKGLFKEKGQPTLRLVADQFNSISPESSLKWGHFNPKPGVYNYTDADAFVEFGQKNKMYVLGHVLFWHNQTPDWVFKDKNGKTLSREQLLKRMRERVRHLAKRYGSRIHAWDVVNEAFMDNGELRDSQWTRIIGDDFIKQAFRIANEELPANVELLYNDYSMYGKEKRDAVLKMIRELKQKKIRIDGVGMQGHWSVNGDYLPNIEASIVAFSQAGVDVHITELDIDVLPRKAGMWGADVRKRFEGDASMDPYRNGLPEAKQQELAKRYTDLFQLFLKHKDKIKRVTFWGPTDRYSWLNNWPIKGRTSHPLLFDRDRKPKPAFHAVVGLKDN